MWIFKRCVDELYQRSILNTFKKKLLVYSIAAYYPAITLLVGSPYPDMLQQVDFPFSLFQFDETIVKLIETASTTLGLIGSVSIGVFWIHRQSNNKHIETNKRISDLEDNLCKKIESAVNEVKKLMVDKEGHQNDMFNQKIQNNTIEILHLKETDKEVKEDIRSLEKNIYELKGKGGQQE